MKPETVAKLNPANVPDYSPTMYRIIGAVTGIAAPPDTRERVPGPDTYSSFSITSDGFVIAQPGRRESGDFIGTSADFNRNIRKYLEAAGLTRDEQLEFLAALLVHVTDFSIYGSAREH